METLFAPWRLSYLMEPRIAECIFCEALRNRAAADSLLVHEGLEVFTILNRYPYANGHLMVVPKEHRRRLSESTASARAEVMEELSRCQAVLQDEFHPTGFNVGANFGRSGGAGIEDHYHFHLVPRWEGDTNFMTVTGGTRVVPQDLADTRRALAARFREREGAAT